MSEILNSDINLYLDDPVVINFQKSDKTSVKRVVISPKLILGLIEEYFKGGQVIRKYDPGAPRK